MAKTLLSGDEARQKLLAGAAKMAMVVGSTLGPAGHDVLVASLPGHLPTITRDGVTVARHIVLPDAAEDAAAQVLRDAANRTVSEAGDGTTTTVILAEALFSLGSEQLAQGLSVHEFRRQCDAAANAACQAVDAMAVPLRGEMVEHVATISANNDPGLGKLVAEAMRFAGQTGVISIEDSRDWSTTVETVEGMSIPAGYFSPYFAQAQGLATLEWDNPVILVSGAKLSRMTENIQQVVGAILKSGRPLVVFCPDCDGQFLASMVMSAVQGQCKIVVVRVPGTPEEKSGIISDLALATGSRAVNLDMGLDEKDIRTSDLGTCAKASVSQSKTVLTGCGHEKALQDRAAQLMGTQSEERDPVRREIIERRIARLTTGIVTIRVGAASDTEQRQKKARIEDAVLACKCALDDGVVPGGGAAYLRASVGLPEPFSTVLREPVDLLRENAGLGNGFVVDVRTGIPIEDGDLSIIDPAKVVKSAIRNAFSAAAILAGTDHILIPQEATKC